MQTNADLSTLSKFNPVVPMQGEVIDDIRNNFDYSNGFHEVLLSGSIGSSKSLLMAHLAVTHCLLYPKARILIGRRALPDLKSTIFREIVNHIATDLTEGVDYEKNISSASIKFSNGSEIISRSWADRQFSKVRSLDLSAAVIEELVENDSMEFYDEIKMRIGRCQGIPENFIISATNPGSPASDFYKYFIESKDISSRHVYYSRTEDNPFLPSKYINQLKAELDPKLARRMIYGEWIEINKEVVYYAYRNSHNFKNETYQLKQFYPIHISWDFNIGEGKPMSCCCFQYIKGVFHFFDEVIIEGARTLDTCDELANRGILNYPAKYYLHGDATGRSRDTRSNKSDWDLIKQFFANYESKDGPLEFEVAVKMSNPPVRRRHNLTNGYCQNAKNQIRLFVYKECKTLDQGFRLTALKKGSDYIEDDSKNYQHVTTAAGYGITYMHDKQSETTGIIQSKVR